MNNARYCRICLCSLDENCYLLCKSTNDGLTAAGRALFLLTKIDSRAEVREDAPTRLCKSCYDLVLRVKKNDDDVAAKKEPLKERLAKSRSFFFRTKHQREPSSPVPSRIPTPTRSPASKRILTERRQRTSARKLTFAQPIQSTSDLPQPLRTIHKTNSLFASLRSSTDWCCPVCGVCNRTALAEGDLDDRVQAEAADIAKQMSFKSETETKTAMEALKKKGGGSSKGEQQEEELEEGEAHEGSVQDQADIPHNSSPPSGGGVRQRQTGHPQEAHNAQASLAPPHRLPLTPPHPIPQPKGTTSLVVMWLLIIMIFLLVGRRAYLSYSGETLKNLHP